MEINNFEIDLSRNAIVIDGVNFKLLGNSNRFSQANEMIYGVLGYVRVVFLVKESLKECQDEAYSLIINDTEDFIDIDGNNFKVSEHTKEGDLLC